MNHFQYREGVLSAESVSLADIAEQYGTPCYVYSKTAFEESFQAYLDALGDYPGIICYAMKANSNLSVLSLLANKGAGFDIVSVGELERVLAAGGDPSKVVFSGVAKQTHEMVRALEVGIHCFNVESVAELNRLNEVAGEQGKVAPVSLRVNPDVDAGTHPYISTGLKENKFGIDISAAEQVYELAASLPHIKVVGVDCHIGSQIIEVQPFLDAFDRVLMLVDKLAEKGIQVEHVDLGGGVGVRYKDEEPLSLKSYLDEVKARIGQRQLSIVMEPGRSIAANSGVFLTQVEYLKQNDHHNFAIVDGAMNDLIRPSLYQAWQEIKTVAEQPNAEVLNWDVVGPVCETGDFLGKNRGLAIKQGDLLAVMSSGAYGFVMASNYNSRNRVAEILVDGETTHLVRKRESFADQIALETVLEF